MKTGPFDPRKVLPEAESALLMGRLSNEHLVDQLVHWIEHNNRLSTNHAFVKELCGKQAVAPLIDPQEQAIWYLCRYLKPLIDFRRRQFGEPLSDPPQTRLTPAVRKPIRPLKWLMNREALVRLFFELSQRGYLVPIEFGWFEVHFWYAEASPGLTPLRRVLDLSPLRFTLADTDLIALAHKLDDQFLVEGEMTEVIRHFCRADGRPVGNSSTVRSRLKCVDHASIHAAELDEIIDRTRNTQNSRIHSEYRESTRGNTVESKGAFDGRRAFDDTGHFGDGSRGGQNAGPGQTDNVPTSLRPQDSPRQTGSGTPVQRARLIRMG